MSSISAFTDPVSARSNILIASLRPIFGCIEMKFMKDAVQNRSSQYCNNP
jgi:hypothetical protein